LDECKARLKEGTEVISSNQEVITWLNRELSRYQLSGPGLYSSTDPNGRAGTGSVPASAIKTMSAQTSPETPDTDATGYTTVSGLSSGLGAGKPPLNAASNTATATASGNYKDSYEFLRSIDALGGMDDLDMEALGLGSPAGAGGSGGGGGYYEGLLDVTADGLVRSSAPLRASLNGNNKPTAAHYPWQATEFGMDEQ
jgi:hypothetical protein